MTQVDLDKLTQPFPKEAVQKRASGGGRMLDYIPGHVVIHRLNDATGNHWDMEVKDITSKEIGPNTLMMARVALTLPGLGTREGLGVQMVHERGGEDLVKGCVTDALKKAATLFGVGLELYGPDYEAGEAARHDAPPQRPAPRSEPVSQPQQVPAAATPPQLKNIERLITKLGKDRQKIKAYYRIEHLADLTKAQASQLIERFMAEAGETQPQQSMPIAATVGSAGDDRKTYA
jgi:hypothetical protein